MGIYSISIQTSANGDLYRPFLFTIAWHMLSTVHAHSLACNHGQCGEFALRCICGEALGITKPRRVIFCTITSQASCQSPTLGHQGKFSNMSSRGVHFVTSHPVCVWLPVRVLLRMPGRIARTPPSERIFTGRVQEVAWKEVPSGRPGIGVEFFYWQTPSENGPINQMQA